MNMDPQAEFYVGYQKKASPLVATSVRRKIIYLLILAGAVALAVTAVQKNFYFGTYDFGTRQILEGVLENAPYPMLRVLRPGNTGEHASFSRYFLVREGKFGAQAVTSGLAGRRVRVEGTLIYRDGQTMLELAPDGITVVDRESGSTADPQSGHDLGTHTFRGEIVDSKCFLGVMNPGNLKTHKSCAIRCISGGIPPVFLVRDDRGRAVYLLLVSSTGESVNEAVLPVVAQPLEITGRLERQHDVLILFADPESYVKLF